MTNREREFDRLFADHGDAIHRYAMRRDPASADDVVAEVFLVAWRRLDDVPPDDPLPFLYGVARRVHANARRGERRRAALTDRIGEQPPPAATGGDSEVLAALARLPERDREVLMLVAWEGLDHAAAARALGTSKANVAVRMHRARRRLARELEPAAPTLLTEENAHV